MQWGDLSREEREHLVQVSIESKHETTQAQLHAALREFRARLSAAQIRSRARLTWYCLIQAAAALWPLSIPVRWVLDIPTAPLEMCLALVAFTIATVVSIRLTTIELQHQRTVAALTQDEADPIVGMADRAAMSDHVHALGQMSNQQLYELIEVQNAAIGTKRKKK